MTDLPGYDSWLESPYTSGKGGEIEDKYEDYLKEFWSTVERAMIEDNQTGDEQYTDVKVYYEECGIGEPLEFSEWLEEYEQSLYEEAADREFSYMKDEGLL